MNRLDGADIVPNVPPSVSFRRKMNEAKNKKKKSFVVLISIHLTIQTYRVTEKTTIIEDKFEKRDWKLVVE